MNDKRDLWLQGASLALTHLLVVVVLLRAGSQWGYTAGFKGLALHALLFPGWLAYLLFGTGNYACTLLAYPLNSLLWGIGLAWLGQRVRRGQQR